MKDATANALAAARAATIAFWDALEAELRLEPQAPFTQPATPPTPRPVPRDPAPAPKAATPTPPTRPLTRPQAGKIATAKPLPTPLTKPAKPASVLTDEQRAENLPLAVTMAKRIVAMLGPNHPQLIAGLKGQMDLEHLANDAQLIADAVKAAQNE